MTQKNIGCIQFMQKYNQFMHKYHRFTHKLVVVDGSRSSGLLFQIGISVEAGAVVG